eukprot:m.104201 g.104201  ORF g.104201 m.104201 type:complete len:104 (+) comp22438_c0_seq1:316-627(+)
MKNQLGECALIRCIVEGKIDCAKIFLELGQSVHTCDADKYPLLFLACKVKRAESVQLLLEHKASVNQQIEGGLTALILAGSCSARNDARTVFYVLISFIVLLL